MSSEVKSGETAQETVSACLFCKWGGGEIKSLAHLPRQPAPVLVTSMGLPRPTLQPLTPEVGLETIVSPNASGLSRRSSHTRQLSSARVRKTREGAGISRWPQRHCKAPLRRDSPAQEPRTGISLAFSPVAASLRAATRCSEPFLVFRSYHKMGPLVPVLSTSCLLLPGAGQHHLHRLHGTMAAAKRDHQQAPRSLLILSTIPRVCGGALASEKEWVRKEVLPQAKLLYPRGGTCPASLCNGAELPSSSSGPPAPPERWRCWWQRAASGWPRQPSEEQTEIRAPLGILPALKTSVTDLVPLRPWRVLSMWSAATLHMAIPSVALLAKISGSHVLPVAALHFGKYFLMVCLFLSFFIFNVVRRYC